MSASDAGKGRNPVTAVLGFVMRFAANALRRLAILGRYTLICWQQQRLRRVWRKLGQRVHLALEDGEVNPMLTEPVKDAVQKARKLKALKDRHYQAVAALREKIRGVKVAEPASAAAASPEETSEETGL